MDGLFLLIIAFLLFVLIGSIRAFVAGGQIAALKEQVEGLKRQIYALKRRLDRGTEPAPPDKPETEPAPPPPVTERKREPLPTPKFGPPIEERLPPPAVEEPAEVEVQPEPEPVATEPTPEPVAPPRVDRWEKIEEIVGKRWMTYGGGLALFVSMGFFVKYAIDIGWIGPELRVGAGVAVGAAILITGDRFVRRGMRTFGLGLIGAAGLPILYVSLFAAFQLYDLIPQWVSFAAMVVVTVVGMYIALRHDSLVVSFLALVGGLLTPALVSTGQDSRDTLFSYLLLLDLGVLGIAFRRQWRALDVLAFLGTAIYFIGWFTTFYLTYDDPPMVPALLWLGAFYATFLILPFAWHLATRTTATLERFVMGLAVAAAVFWVAYLILHPVHRQALGAVSLVMAACYATLGILVQIRLTADRKAAFAFLAFAMTFLTIAGPLHFRLNGITIAWSAEAALLLFLGYKYRYLPVRLGGLVVLGLAIVRLFVRHWPLHEEPFSLFTSRPFAVAAFVSAAVGAFAIQHSVFRARAREVDRFVRRLTGILAGVLALLVLHNEFGPWFAFRNPEAPEYVFRVTGGAVWGAGALLFLAFGLRWRSLTARLASIGILFTGAGILLSAYVLGLPDGTSAFENARFPVAIGLSAAGVAIGVILSGRSSLFEPLERHLGRSLSLLSSLALVAVVTIDLWLLLEKSSTYAALVGVAALWAAAAGAFLIVATRSRLVAWRVASFGLLLLATAFGFASYLPTRPADFTHFLNARFLVSLFIAFTWIWHGEVSRRFRGILSLIGGVLVLLALSADLAGWLNRYGRPESLAGLALLWAAGSLLFLYLGLRAKEIVWRAGGLLDLIVAVVFAWMLYAENTAVAGGTFFLALPYGVAVAVAAAGFGWGTLLGRHAVRESALGEVVRCAVTLLLLFLTNVELFACLNARSGPYAAWCSLVALNALAVVGLMLTGLRLAAHLWRLGALLVLVATWILAPRLFGHGMHREFLLFLNGRFGALFLAAAATFTIGRLCVVAGERISEGEKGLGRFLLWATALLLLIVLSTETWLYSKQEAADAFKARFATQMALSVTWSVYAVIQLWIGFRFRLRALRLAALGLFGITVGKLVLVDLDAIEQEQLFRILSFFVAGVLMIGGSYLYHRVEKHMEKKWEE